MMDGITHMFIVFGRPGAGKSTISEEAARSLIGYDSLRQHHFLHLDLDVCVPQWMRDNFSKGVYPTLQQRADFMSNTSQYVKGEIITVHQKVPRPLMVIVSFSFVNTDLRVAFRDAFPDAHWILVDTHKDLAQERILCREGHFYKAESLNNSEVAKNSSNETISEWEFQPVDFPHVLLDGRDTADTNAKLLLEFIERSALHQSTTMVEQLPRIP